MWRCKARMKIEMITKKMNAWTAMALRLVLNVPNSIIRSLPGNSKNNPGDNIAKNTTATTTGAQSAIDDASLIRLIND